MNSRAIFLSTLLLLTVGSARAELYDWVNRFAGGSSMGETIGLDAGGNVYVAGQFTNAIVIGTNQFVCAGAWDIFLAKLNPTGEPIWAITAGGTNYDSVRRLVVTANGTVFMCGTLSPGATFGTTGPGATGLSEGGEFVARIDDGVLSWLDQFTAVSNGAVSSLTLSLRDQTVWAVGGDGHQMIVKQYHHDGVIVTDFFIGNAASVNPGGIAVGADGAIFIIGAFGFSLNLGTTNLIMPYSGPFPFTTGLDRTGNVLWAWWTGSPDGRGPGAAIALAPAGDVISIGNISGPLAPYAFVAKHSHDGTFQWMRTLGETHGWYEANDVTVDANGYILMIGSAESSYYDPKHGAGVLLAVYSPNGDRLFTHLIKSLPLQEGNAGHGIASDAIGNIVFTGGLMGTPTFGTNVMGDGPYGIGNAFVARRPTLEPALALHRTGTNFMLTWPRAAMPYALQQTEDVSSTNWLNVTQPPEQIGERKRVTVAGDLTNRFFRLKMTNEAPIRHLPDITWWSTTWPSFLGQIDVYVTTSNSAPSPHFVAYAEDPDDDNLRFEWFNDNTAQLLTNGTSAVGGYLDPSSGTQLWIATLADDTITFPIGTNTISLVAFDGTFRVTNSVALEVISVVTAINRIVTALNVASTNSSNAELIGALESARDEFESGQFALAMDRLYEFEVLLEAATGISDADKQLFNHAGEMIVGAFHRTVQRMPVVAASAQTFLLAWVDETIANSPPHRLLGLRADANGIPLDTEPFFISESLAQMQGAPAVACDGTNFLVAWTDTGGASNSSRLCVTLVQANGVVLVTNGTTLNTTTAGNPTLKLIGGAEGFLLIWPDSTGHIRGARISSAGEVLDPSGVAMDLLPGMNGVLGSDGSNYIYVAQRYLPATSNYATFRWRIAQANASVSGAAQIGPPHPYQSPVSLTFNGSRFLLANYSYPSNMTVYLNPDGTYLAPGPILPDGYGSSGNASANGEFLVLMAHGGTGIDALQFSGAGDLISSNANVLRVSSASGGLSVAASSNAYLLLSSEYAHVVATVLTTNGSLRSRFSP